ncbi:MAG: alpha/beta fold hydrolase [Bacteroidota bacterium]
MMHAHFLAYQEQQIHYCTWGNGSQLLIAIPGYADRAVNYGFLEKSMGQRHTIIAIDLPGHGNTQWDKAQFSPEDFIQIIDKLLLTTGQRRFKLMGHSFGGRVVLALVQHFQKQIDFVYLLAPDGLKPWDLKYSRLLPTFFRRLVGTLIGKPAPVLALATWLHRFSLLPTSSYRFLQVYLKTPTQRSRLILFWNSLPAFRIKRPNLHGVWSANDFSIAIIFGKDDQIIAPRLGKKVSEQWPQIDCYLIEGNHFILGETLAAQLKKIDKNLESS